MSSPKLDSFFSSMVFIGTVLLFGFDYIAWQTALFWMLAAIYLRGSAIYTGLEIMRSSAGETRKDESGTESPAEKEGK